MITLKKCEICDALHDVMRDHCPVCGAKRVILGSHGFQRQQSQITHRDIGNMSAELVKGIRYNWLYNYVVAEGAAK